MATGWAGHRVRRRRREDGPDLERGDGRARRSSPDRTDRAGCGAVLQPGRASPRCLVLNSDPWLWDISQNPPRATVLRHEEDYVATIGFSAGGHRLITVAPMHTSGDDGAVSKTGNVFDISSDFTPSAVRVWDTDTGEPAGPPILGPGGDPLDFMDGQRASPIFAAAISPDGQRVLVSTGKELRLHDVATGEPVDEPWIDTSGGKSPAVALTFSADGASVVSVDRQTSALKFWEVETGRPVGNLMIGHTSAVPSVDFTADGKRIVSRGVDDGWMLWPSPDSWRDALCDKLAVNMTRAEWDEWVSPTIEYHRPCPTLDVPD